MSSLNRLPVVFATGSLILLILVSRYHHKQKNVASGRSAQQTIKTIGVEELAQSNNEVAYVTVRQRLKGAFTSVYLTLVSLVQATIFGYLVQTVDNRYTKFTFTEWIIVFVTFLVIVTVWHEYMQGATALIWIPTIIDSLIPFLLVITEFFLVISINYNLSNWLLSMALFSFCGLFAYINMYWQAKNYSENTYIMRIIKKYIIITHHSRNELGKSGIFWHTEEHERRASNHQRAYR